MKTGGTALYVREQLKCMELCLGMDEEPTERLCERNEKTSSDGIVMGAWYRLPDQKSN